MYALHHLIRGQISKHASYAQNRRLTFTFSEQWRYLCYSLNRYFKKCIRSWCFFSHYSKKPQEFIQVIFPCRWRLQLIWCVWGGSGFRSWESWWILKQTWICQGYIILKTWLNNNILQPFFSLSHTKDDQSRRIKINLTEIFFWKSLLTLCQNHWSTSKWVFRACSRVEGNSQWLHFSLP